MACVVLCVGDQCTNYITFMLIKLRFIRPKGSKLVGADARRSAEARAALLRAHATELVELSEI